MKKIFTILAVSQMMALSVFAQKAITSSSLAKILQSSNPQLTTDDLKDIEITSQYQSEHNGITHVYFRQVVNGIPVFNSSSSVHLDKNKQPVQINCAFIKEASQKVNTTSPGIGVSSAIGIAGNHIGMNLLPVLGKASVPANNGEVSIMDISVSPEPVKAKMYYLIVNNELKLTWGVEVFDEEKNDWWNIRLDASTGEVLEQNNYVTKCTIHPGAYTHDFSSLGIESVEHVHQMNKKTSTGTYNAYARPLESPLYGGRTMISSQSKANASPFGWHDTDGVAGADWTITRGNNVWAKEDTAARNGAGYSPDGGANLVFDFPIDSNWVDSRLNLDAAITNLFVWNNVCHDIFYQYGFTEAAGNFQTNNYGKGGSGSDGVHADAQDGSGTSNANFASPADGTRGRMQMYLWPVGGTPSAPPMRINAPASLVANYTSPIANFGPKKFGSIVNNLIMMSDTLGCTTPSNAQAISGKIAIMYRGGGCSFTTKVQNAQNAGAIAAIVIQNTTSSPTAMTGSSSTITIPSVMISKTIGDQINVILKGPDSVNVTLQGIPDVKAYDSDFDNGVIVHEFGHGISNRLTGGPANSNCLSNQEQAGEGWSDFFCLALTAKATDKAEDGRGIGNWVADQELGGLGIRTFRYSRSMSVSGNTTYDDIKSLSVPHGVGSVWCAMLWDIFWDMVDKYGFDEDIYNGTGGNNKTIQLVMDGLKLQPCNPGFVDARNAILKADSINNGKANHELLWKAFARRGLGFSASQGSTSSRSDGTESYDLPSDIQPTGVAALNHLSGIKMAPNPTEGIVRIIFSEKTAAYDVKVFDISGKMVYSTTGSQATETSLNLEHLSNGLYIIRIADQNNHIFQQKLTIAH